MSAIDTFNNLTNAYKVIIVLASLFGMFLLYLLFLVITTPNGIVGVLEGL